MSELESYKVNVERLAELDSQEIFSNGRSEHAAVIFSVFFKNAKKRVAIFCNNLNPAVFSNPDVIKEMEASLLRGVEVDILAQESPENDSIATKIQEWIGRNLPIKFKQASARSYIKNIDANFSIVDDKAYRYEPKHDDLVAFACMNNVETAISLGKIFHALKASA